MSGCQGTAFLFVGQSTLLASPNVPPYTETQYINNQGCLHMLVEMTEPTHASNAACKFRLIYAKSMFNIIWQVGASPVAGARH